MTAADVGVAGDIQQAAFHDLLKRSHQAVPEDPPLERRQRWLRIVGRFVAEDGPGCHIAEVDGRPAGMAVALRRGGLWGLALLFVHPEQQSRGVGRALMEAALGYAEGASLRMIMASEDPRAARRYARAGLDLHPGFAADGPVDRGAIPASLGVRDGTRADLDLVDAVDAGLRGPSRSTDIEFLLGEEAVLHVADAAGARGFALQRYGRPMMLGADTVAVARSLLWRLLADVPDDGDAEFWGLTASQNWAVDVLLAAGLRIRPGGPFFLSGMPAPPRAYIPSGIFF